MLDVHVPHATHTWQDFLIHIGTIVVGLFIAIGLKQTVEAIHHARERQELIDEMRAEAEQNIAVLHANLEVDVTRLQLDLALIALLRAAQPRDGIVTIVRSPHTATMHQYPARAIWTSAKANGKVALLSDRQSAIYDRLDYNAEMATLRSDRMEIAGMKVQGDAFGLGINMSPGTSFSLPAGEVSGLISDIALDAAATSNAANWDANWLAACEAVSAGVRTREDFLPYLFRKRARGLDRPTPQTLSGSP
jgi:hypothetical protein